MTDPATPTIAQSATMAEAYRILSADDMLPVRRQPHENGYFAAQAAGFKVLADVESLHACVEATPATFSYNSLPDEVFGNDAHDDMLYEMRARAMSSGCIHALSIARAQGKPPAIIEILEAGIAAQALWAAMTDDQRTWTTHGPIYDDGDWLVGLAA